MLRSNPMSVTVRLCGVTLLAALASVGCQSDYAGQTLPSPYWQTDDVQYFPPGPEFKLSREAAALKTYGTGKTNRPPVGPAVPVEGAPAPGAELPPAPAGVVAPGVVAPPPGPPPIVPGGAEAAPPPPEEAPEADPFNP